MPRAGRATSAGSADGRRARRRSRGLPAASEPAGPAARSAAGRDAGRSAGVARRAIAGRRSREPARDIGDRGARPARSRRGRDPRTTSTAPCRAAGRACAVAARRPPRCPARKPTRSSAPARRSPPAIRRPLLLDGVTGGGKTAIYVEAIAASLEAGRPALVLVPEIALALPLVDRLRADLDARVALVHSGLGDGERADEWRRIRAGDVDIVVGTRLAVGAPLADVGVVIVDEEHDPAYKSDRTPRLQARDTAIRLGRAGRCGDRPRLGDAGGREPRARRGGHATTAWSCRRDRPVSRRSSRSSTCAPSSRRAIAACSRGRSTMRWPALDTAARRPGDPRAQPARDRVGRPLPRLRPRAGLPGLRAAARLPPGRHDAALPPLRAGHAARHALPELPARRGSATSAAARSASSGRSGTRTRGSASRGSTGT